MAPPPKRPIKVVLKSSSSSSASSSTASLKSSLSAGSAAAGSSRELRLESEDGTETEEEQEEGDDDDVETEDVEDEEDNGSNDSANDDDFDDSADAYLSSSESLESGTATLQPSPRKMTARQKALLVTKEEESEARGAQPTPVAAAEGSGRRLKRRILTEEEMLLESEKVRKRKHLREQKLEESKRATIERLLQKQSSRSKKTQIAEPDDEQPTTEDWRSRVPLSSKSIKYISNKGGECLLIPQDTDCFPCHREEEAHGLPSPLLCSARGCKNPKTCSNLQGRPLCASLSCYQKLRATNE